MKTINLLLAAVILVMGIALAAYLTAFGSSNPAVASDEHEHGEAHEEKHSDLDAGHAHEHAEGEDDQAHEEGEGHDETVTISDAAAREAGIEIGMAGPATIQGAVSLPGEIALNANTLVHVVPRLPGVVREVHKNLGDTIAKGDLLALLDSRELADAKSDFLAALERRELANARFVREKELFAKKISSEDEYLSAKQSLAELNIAARVTDQKLKSLGLSEDQIAGVRSGKDAALTAYPIHAPIAGTVIEKHMSTGEAVEDNADAFVIADLTTVWAEIVIYAADLKRIRLGQTVTVHSDDLDINAEGKISYIGSLVGQQTRTAKATVELPNPEGLWRPGLFVTISLASDPVDVAVAVPADAVQTMDGASVVFVKDGEKYTPRKVSVGRRGGNWVEIVDGLKAGENYVTKNSYLVKADIEKAGAAHEH